MRALIVEDELHNLEHLRSLLNTHFPYIELMGEARNAAEAEKLIREGRPDVIFLDVQMPGESGLDLLMRLSPIEAAIIFVTAYDQYALQAIRMAALHYIIKPVLPDDLKEAIFRVEDRMMLSGQSDQVAALVDQLRTGRPARTMALPLGEETRFINLDDLMYCVCENNYTDFFMHSEKHKLKSCKGAFEFERRLLAARFMRCHHSYIVNRIHVRSLHKGSGNWQLEMTNGFKIPVSRLRKDRVRAWLSV